MAPRGSGQPLLAKSNGGPEYARESKEARRVKRREDEAEQWAQARIQNQTYEARPTNKSGREYLARNYPGLMDPLDDEDDFERPLEYVLKEAKPRRGNRRAKTAKVGDPELIEDDDGDVFIADSNNEPKTDSARRDLDLMPEICLRCHKPENYLDGHFLLPAPCCGVLLGINCKKEIMDEATACPKCGIMMKVDQEVLDGHGRIPVVTITNTDLDDSLVETTRGETHSSIYGASFGPIDDNSTTSITKDHGSLEPPQLFPALSVVPAPPVKRSIVPAVPDIAALRRRKTINLNSPTKPIPPVSFDSFAPLSISQTIPPSIDSHERVFSDLSRPERLSVLLATAHHRTDRAYYRESETFERRKYQHMLKRINVSEQAFNHESLAHQKRILYETNAQELFTQKQISGSIKETDDMLLINALILQEAFKQVIDPEHLPRGITAHGGQIYSVVAPPGLGGPSRPSMLFTKIWASRMVIRKIQPGPISNEIAQQVPGALYFHEELLSEHGVAKQYIRENTSVDFAGPFLNKNLPMCLFHQDSDQISSRSIPFHAGPRAPIFSLGGASRCQPQSKASRRGFPAKKGDHRHKKFNLFTQARTSTQNTLRSSVLMPTSFKVIKIKEEPPIRVFNKRLLADPRDLEVNIARCRLALQCVRNYDMRITPRELLAFMAVRVPAVETYLAKEAEKAEQADERSKSSQAKCKENIQAESESLMNSNPREAHNAGIETNQKDQKSIHYPRFFNTSNTIEGVAIAAANAGLPDHLEESDSDKEYDLKWKPEDWIGYRVVPDVLQLSDEPVDLESLIREAKLSIWTPDRNEEDTIPIPQDQQSFRRPFTQSLRQSSLAANTASNNSQFVSTRPLAPRRIVPGQDFSTHAIFSQEHTHHNLLPLIPQTQPTNASPSSGIYVDSSYYQQDDWQNDGQDLEQDVPQRVVDLPTVASDPAITTVNNASSGAGTTNQYEHAIPHFTLQHARSHLGALNPVNNLQHSAASMTQGFSQAQRTISHRQSKAATNVVSPAQYRAQQQTAYYESQQRQRERVDQDRQAMKSRQEQRALITEQQRRANVAQQAHLAQQAQMRVHQHALQYAQRHGYQHQHHHYHPQPLALHQQHQQAFFLPPHSAHTQQHMVPQSPYASQATHVPLSNRTTRLHPHAPVFRPRSSQIAAGAASGVLSGGNGGGESRGGDEVVVRGVEEEMRKASTSADVTSGPAGLQARIQHAAAEIQALEAEIESQSTEPVILAIEQYALGLQAEPDDDDAVVEC